MKKVMIFFLSAVLILLLVVGCGNTNRPAKDLNQTEEQQLLPIKVIVSIFPLEDVVKQIGGNLVEVKTLLPAGASEHTYELTPKQIKDFMESELYVKIGQGLEFFDDKLLSNQEGRQVKEIIFADMVDLVEVEIVTLASLAQSDNDRHSQDDDHEDDVHEDEDEDDHDHDHEGADPHVWLDPVLVRDVLVPAVYESLVQMRPEYADTFKENKLSFQEQLTELNEAIIAETNTFSQRNFIVFHSAWRYFSQRYGLTDVNVEEFPSQEVSLKRVAEIVEIARRTGAKAIFAEPQFSPRAAQEIAKEFGGEVQILDPLGGPDLPGRDSYISLMRYNLQVLKEALQ